MKFSNFFYAFLATLAAASPIRDGADVAEDTELATRFENTVEGVELVARKKDPIIKESDELQKLRSLHGDPQIGRYYYLEVQWPLGAIQGSSETPAELSQLRASLGFDHIGIVVGQVTEKKQGTPNSPVLKRHFDAQFYHMVKKTDGSTELSQGTWSARDTKPTFYIGETTKRKAEKVKGSASSYVKQNKVYNVQTNNCNSFYQAMLAVVR